jgi:hypothetical protein
MLRSLLDPIRQDRSHVWHTVVVPSQGVCFMSTRDLIYMKGYTAVSWSWYLHALTGIWAVLKLCCCNEQSAKLIRDVALRALWRNSQFSKLVFPQNYPLVLVGIYFMPSCIKLKVLDISSYFLLDESCRKMYTIFSAVLHVRPQRKSDVMTYVDHSARSRSAVYYQAGSFPIRLTIGLFLGKYARSWKGWCCIGSDLFRLVMIISAL